MGRPRLPWIMIWQQILTSEIMTLPESYRWNFIGLLLVASDEPKRGQIRPHWLENNRKLLANRLGTSTKLLANSVQSLVELGAIIEDANGISIINYHKYQQLRENKPEKTSKNSEKNTDSISDDIDIDINTEINTDKKREKSSSIEDDTAHSKKAKPARKNFSKPTPEEVTEYAHSIDFVLDGELFCDYYEARGWKFKTGQPMKDWKAAVRAWKRNGYNSGNTSGKGNLEKWLEQSMAENDEAENGAGERNERMKL